MRRPILPYPMIDIHSHILPGIDDGSRDMEESLKLLAMAHEQGIGAVFATPHYSDRRPRPDQSGLRGELETCLHERFPDFPIYPGHENFYHEGLAEKLLENPELRLAKGHHVLVEFDPMTPYETMFRGMRRILDAGFIPVLAHVERYRCLRTEEKLLELLKCGCRYQMNFDSLAGNRFSADVRWCRWQVKNKRIFAMGTDMHRMDFRPPQIGRAVTWMAGNVEPGLLREMLYENPMRMLEEHGPDWPAAGPQDKTNDRKRDYESECKCS